MSTRIGITLEDDLYIEYKVALAKEKKTIQEDIQTYIKAKVQKSAQKEQ